MRVITHTPDELDSLAHSVATALDQGEEAHAWRLTRALEDDAGIDEGGAQPSGPVIGRRFARAHRRLAALTVLARADLAERSAA